MERQGDGGVPGHLGRRRVQVLDGLVGGQHFRRLIVQVDGVDVDAGCRLGGRAPHGRVKGQAAAHQPQGLVLELVQGALQRQAVERQKQLAEFVMGLAEHAVLPSGSG
ncbi:hypothetical protein D3C87_1863700 [compost metagenome]